MIEKDVWPMIYQEFSVGDGVEVVHVETGRKCTFFPSYATDRFYDFETRKWLRRVPPYDEMEAPKKPSEPKEPKV